ncbi:hypothetical protein B0H11DRAFT_2257613 [Mycena galericulata]|nr:hypothetical protein B0H11DRAFT_2257613 [Mycena galericulata]
MSFSTSYVNTGLSGIYMVSKNFMNLDDVVHFTLKELTRMSIAPTSVEVEHAKSQLKARLLLGLDGSTAIIEQAVDAVSLEDIIRVAKKYLWDKNFAMAAVGNIEGLLITTASAQTYLVNFSAVVASEQAELKGSLRGTAQHAVKASASHGSMSPFSSHSMKSLLPKPVKTLIMLFSRANHAVLCACLSASSARKSICTAVYMYIQYGRSRHRPRAYASCTASRMLWPPSAWMRLPVGMCWRVSPSRNNLCMVSALATGDAPGHMIISSIVFVCGHIRKPHTQPADVDTVVEEAEISPEPLIKNLWRDIYYKGTKPIYVRAGRGAALLKDKDTCLLFSVGRKNYSTLRYGQSMFGTVSSPLSSSPAASTPAIVSAFICCVNPFMSHCGRVTCSAVVPPALPPFIQD